MAEPASLSRVHDLFNNERLRKLLVSIRAPLGVVALLATVPFMKADWFWPAVAVSALGEALQLWCFASLCKTVELSANGPYAVVRNPMYMGRYFLILGGLMLLANPWLLGAFTVLYYFYMVNRVSREEKKLRKVLGQPYLDYCAKVGRFLPSFRVYDGSRLWYANATNIRENHALANGLAVVAFYALAYIAIFHLG